MATSAAGLKATPTTGTPFSTSPIETQNSGIFFVNSLVPSMGSTIQTRCFALREGSSTVSSESSPSSGNASRRCRAMMRSLSRSARVRGLSSDFSQCPVPCS